MNMRDTFILVVNVFISGVAFFLVFFLFLPPQIAWTPFVAGVLCMPLAGAMYSRNKYRAGERFQGLDRLLFSIAVLGYGLFLMLAIWGFAGIVFSHSSDQGGVALGAAIFGFVMAPVIAAASICATWLQARILSRGERRGT